MKRFWLSLLFLVVSQLVLVSSVEAIGVGIKPKQLDLSIQVGRETVTELLVMNVTQEPALYQLYPDGLVDEIKIEPKEFRLEAGANQIVQVKIKAKTTGRFQTDISVVGRPLSAGGLPVASGIKVPITLVVTGIVWWRLVLGLIVAGCLVVIFVVKLRK